MIRRFLLACVLMGVFVPQTVLAHTVVWSQSEADATVLDFRYSSGEPMTFAKIVVRAPNSGTETQNGRTDRNGRFAFSPDQDGVWTITVDDGTGHVLTATPEIKNSNSSVTPVMDPFQNSAFRQDGWTIRILLGISAILNLFFLARFFMLRKNRNAV